MAKSQNWIIIERLGGVILENAEGHIFEIGAGHSTPILGKLAKDFGRKFYSFDKREDRCNLAKKFGGTALPGRSLENIDKLSKVTIAMGLIDGKHTAATVRAEISFFLKRLSVGGVIFLHDTYRCTSLLLRPESTLICDVYKVRKELEALDTIQIFTWPYTAMNCGLSMVMKMDPNRPFYEM